MTEPRFSHLDAEGRPRMVDVGNKEQTTRTAVAEGWIRMAPETVSAIELGATSKGNVRIIAELAGIMAAKRTAEWIPLCHPLALSGVQVQVEPDANLPGLRAQATVRVNGPTGVEMEALTAVSCALLTVYDMCKGLDRGMEIGGVRLLRKEGGRSGAWTLSAG